MQVVQYIFVAAVVLLAVALAVRWVWGLLHPPKGKEMHCPGCSLAGTCDKNIAKSCKKCEQNVAQSRK